MTSVAEHAHADERESVGGLGDLARDIARGGLAGLVAGVLIGGIGGRVVMRLAALAVPDSAGLLTENGNRIGAITIGGSMGLVIFIGLFAGLAAGIVWVTVSPWIPGAGIRRAILTMPIAVALSGFFLIRGDNLDFLALRHDALVVLMLLAIPALIGFTIAWLDDGLDRRLPRVSVGSPVVGIGYAVLTAIGLVFLPPIVGAYFERPATVPMAIALLATGMATVVWWGLRLRGQQVPPQRLVMAGRAALLAAVILGTVALVPEVVEALGAS
ncbi:MAG: hypothetical protein A2Z32_07395 [Chloroflexi bacterium RBG_16_69_14]|nr:MAG: hypothetical protein A2Z32_07395 [Chloroflexi bacterium RBG_16_69_14]